MTVYTIQKCPHCGKPIRKRSEEQSRGLHASIDEIAAQLDWPIGSGIYRDSESFWKPMFKVAFERAEGNSAEMYPALDGRGFDFVLPSTARMSKEQISDLWDFVLAFGVEHGVKFSDGKDAA